MKILHLVGQSEDVGGILSVIRNLQEATREQGLRHVVYVNQAYREARTPALEYRFGRRCLDEHRSHLRLLVRGLFGARELGALLAAEYFDVVHGHYRGMMPSLAWVSWSRRRKVLYTNHAYARRTRMYRLLARSPRFHSVLLSPNMARHYRLSPAPPKVSLIPDCCADHLFSQPLISSSPGTTGDGGLRLVGLGSILGWKKWHLLLEAIAQLPPSDRSRIQFHHWGSVLQLAESREYQCLLAAETRRLGLTERVCFHGATGDIEHALRQADWFVLPSTNEPCSVALSEAMALGLPALVSASGGNLDLVENGRTGAWFEPDNAQDLAQRLLDILAGRIVPASAAAIREAARPRSATAAGAAYVELYRALAKTGARKPLP
jgi:glycosyltransferase involved in cell wall biosynthesis